VALCGGRDRDGGRHLVAVEVTVKALLLCLILSFLLSVCGVGCGMGQLECPQTFYTDVNRFICKIWFPSPSRGA
jgi:hypothetical protein